MFTYCRSKKDNKYYIGSTSDVMARVSFHNAGLQRSTKNRIPFELVLFEEYDSKEEALKREKQIKSWKGGMLFKNCYQGSSPAIGGAPGLGPGGRRFESCLPDQSKWL